MNNYLLYKLSMMTLKPLLVAFDFDRTIVEDNSDTVVRGLLKDEKALAESKDLYRTHGWTVYMEKTFEALRKSNTKRRDIEQAISTISPVNGFPSLMENLHSRNVEIVIISDSNSVFINHWLKHWKLEHTIEEVYTNPAWFDDTGLLKIKVYHEQDWCKLSEKNMCKGYILDNHVKRRNAEGVNFARVAYVGDGINDLCPVLRLSYGDIAFPRLDYPLSKLLSSDTAVRNAETRHTKAEIIPWKDGTEIWQELVKKIPRLDQYDDCDS